MRTILPGCLLALVLLSPASGRDLVLPNRDITPGVARTDIDEPTICVTRWGKDARHVTAKMKRVMFLSYGIKCKPLFKGARVACGRWETDHCVSRELGGADDVRNLWPQSYRGTWNARVKDRLENRLHRELCAGRITLQTAQTLICADDWRVAYARYFGQPERKRHESQQRADQDPTHDNDPVGYRVPWFFSR